MPEYSCAARTIKKSFTVGIIEFIIEQVGRIFVNKERMNKKHFDSFRQMGTIRVMEKKQRTDRNVIFTITYQGESSRSYSDFLKQTSPLSGRSAYANISSKVSLFLSQ